MSEFDNTMLAAIVPLREAGLALHWLRARSKAPVEKGWSTLPVASLDDLRRTHFARANLGVRLGEPSPVAGGYLHVFDFDIRFPDLVDEAMAAFSAILPDLQIDTFPRVRSGSGGESFHLYFTLSKPFFSKKLLVSEGKHRGSDGSWHYDWEIELFGTGKQVAMPPSIHPDTGKPYVWITEPDFTDFEPLPSIDPGRIEALAVAQTATYEFETREPLTFKAGQMERELDSLPVSRLDDYHDWITLGQALHHQTGASEAGFELWVQHSKRSEKFDGKLRAMRQKWRGFGKNRRQPVTMATIRQWFQEARLDALVADEFDDLPEPGEADEFDDLPPVGANDDFDDLITAKPASSSDDDCFDLTPAEKAADEEWKKTLEWVSLLDVNEEGAFKPTLHNVRLLVEHDPRTAGVVAFNEFTQEIVQRGTPGRKKGREKAAKPTVQLDGSQWKLRDAVNGDFWTEDKDNAIRAVFEAPKTQGGYGIKIPDRDLRAAIDIAGRRNCFHPVREYLSGLTWDQKPRVEQLFSDYVGAPDDAYHRNVSRIMMIAAVARVFEPGMKFDTAVVLEGLQGKRKSTFISILAKNWFAELDCDITDTQSVVELLQGAWIVELNELGGLTKADVRHVKAFISRRSDKVRLAYAKRAQEYHRQSILIGSTNDDVYLKDSTGGRRFLPVRCQIAGEIDTDRLLQEVDQLWAEALHLYQEMRVAQPKGTLPLYLSDADARQIAEKLQESRMVESSEDALAGRIAEWLEKPINTGGFDDNEDGTPRYRNKVCLLEIWTECLGRDEAAYQGVWPATLGRAMRMIPNWTDTGKRDRFGRFGQQRGFHRRGRAQRALDGQID